MVMPVFKLLPLIILGYFHHNVWGGGNNIAIYFDYEAFIIMSLTLL
jgi:hypothetical protein